ncbi:MAG: hypothetical protein IPI67_39090 [Myxococcales bacterium]|nr:hypothetical protein [Myxococcales bacterium]
MVTRRQALLCAVLAMLALIACKRLDAPGSSGCNRMLGRTDERERASFAAWDFRQVSLKSTAKALEAYADAPVRAKWVALEADVWPSAHPKFGWSYLLGSSVLCAGGLREGKVPMAFYHPWSDAFLVMLWNQSGARPRLEDVEVLTGEYVRHRSVKPLRAVRGWTEQATFAPYAVGFSTAESAKAFEQLFSAEALAQGFRSVTNGLSDPALMEANHVAAGQQLMQNLAELAPVVAKSRDGFGDAVRGKLAEVTDLFVRRQASTLASEATATPEPSKKALASMGIDDWKRMSLVSVVKGDGRSLLLLSHVAKPDLFMGMLLAEEGSSLRIRRVDVLSFKAFVENADALRGPSR